MERYLPIQRRRETVLESARPGDDSGGEGNQLGGKAGSKTEWVGYSVLRRCKPTLYQDRSATLAYISMQSRLSVG
jgi:hypothetical protein